MSPPFSSRSPTDSRPIGRLESIQSLRGIAALLVVGYHLAEIFELRYCERQLLGWMTEYGFAGVDLFFVISGLIMVVTSRDSLTHGGGFLRFLLRRAIRIYPMYWMVTTFLLFASLIVPALARRDSFDVFNIVASYLLLPQNVYPILAPGWTLIYEMFFYLVFGSFFAMARFDRRWQRTIPSWVLAAIAWAIGTVCIYVRYDQPEFARTTDFLMLPIYGCPLTLEFIAGCLVGWAVVSQGIAHFARTSLFIGMGWFVCGAPFVEQALGRSAEFGHARVLSFGIAAVLITYGLVTLELACRDKSLTNERRPALTLRSWFHHLGDASYSLYLTHMLVLHALGVAYAKLGREHLSQSMMLTLAFATCILVGLIAYRFVEAPLNQKLKKLALSSAAK